MSTTMSPSKKLSPLLWIVLSLAVAGCGQPDTRLDFTKILPETQRPQEVQLLDADGDGEDEWIVFYKFDLVEGTTGRKFSPIGGAVYDADHGDPPVVFPHELLLPDQVYLGEQNCVAEVRDLITTNDGKELLVSNYAEENLVVDLSVFHWYDQDKDDLSKSPGEEQQGYECLGSFHGSGGITIDGSRVVVKERTEERSQLSRKNVYKVKEGSYFRLGGKELWPPEETSIEFTFGVPEDVAQSPYPEKIVLAFYLALGQDNSLAQTYLSETSGLKNLVGSSNFGTFASGDQIQKVLVKRIIYTPDKEKEERHEPVVITVSVASVTSAREDQPRDVTWLVIWEPSSEGVPKPGWKLHRMIFFMSP
jgi:hypothetical protein